MGEVANEPFVFLWEEFQQRAGRLVISFRLPFPQHIRLYVTPSSFQRERITPSATRPSVGQTGRISPTSTPSGCGSTDQPTARIGHLPRQRGSNLYSSSWRKKI